MRNGAWQVWICARLFLMQALLLLRSRSQGGLTPPLAVECRSNGHDGSLSFDVTPPHRDHVIASLFHGRRFGA
ncbi:hypothetical protein EDB89DRAFT_1984918 [Lactarius sanguifluus]|nr:hypothetical protein EDB89DRAFT_1984918 [Lactarius sanguifluus]